MRRVYILVLFALLSGVLCAADEMRFYRVVSAPAARIIDFDASGEFVWQESMSNSGARIESSPSMHGAWTNCLAVTNAYRQGSVQTLQLSSNGTFYAPQTNAVIWTAGHVVFTNLEGGFYGIRGDDGRGYDPLQGLPQAMQSNGLRVVFWAREVSNMASIHMWGTIVRLLHIETE